MPSALASNLGKGTRHSTFGWRCIQFAATFHHIPRGPSVCARRPSNGTRRSTFWWLALAAVRTPGSGPWAVMTLRQPSYTARAVIYGPAQSSRRTGAVICGAAEEHFLQRASDELSADLWRETCTTLQLLDLASWRQQPSRLCFSVYFLLVGSRMMPTR